MKGLIEIAYFILVLLSLAVIAYWVDKLAKWVKDNF